MDGVKIAFAIALKDFLVSHHSPIHMNSNNISLGGDCSLLDCPKGKAWTDSPVGIDDAHNLAPCSNRGLCDTTTGLCTCSSGYEGAGCDRLSCPSNCNSVGVCMTMNAYSRTKDPGLNPSHTLFAYDLPWDAFKIQGCNCDVQFYGPDCSLRYCANGCISIFSGFSKRFIL
jgi:hypothetical protein